MTTLLTKPQKPNALMNAKRGAIDPEFYNFIREFRSDNDATVYIATTAPDNTLMVVCSVGDHREEFVSRICLRLKHTIMRLSTKIVESCNAKVMLEVQEFPADLKLLLEYPFRLKDLLSNLNSDDFREEFGKLYDGAAEYLATDTAILGTLLAMGGPQKVNSLLSSINTASDTFNASYQFDSCEIDKTAQTALIALAAEDHWLLAYTENGCAYLGLEELYAQQTEEITIVCDWKSLPDMTDSVLQFIRKTCNVVSASAYIVFEVSTSRGCLQVPISISWDKEHSEMPEEEIYKSLLKLYEYFEKAALQPTKE